MSSPPPIPSAAQVQEAALRHACLELLCQCLDEQAAQFNRLYGDAFTCAADRLPAAYELLRRIILASRAFPEAARARVPLCGADGGAT